MEETREQLEFKLQIKNKEDEAANLAHKIESLDKAVSVSAQLDLEIDGNKRSAKRFYLTRDEVKKILGRQMVDILEEVAKMKLKIKEW